MIFNCHLWCRALSACTHFQFQNIPLVPLGLYFHSETSASFRCSSDKHWRVLLHHLGSQQQPGLSHIQGARKRKQRLVKGNMWAETQKQKLKLCSRGCFTILPPSVSADDSHAVLFLTPFWQDPAHSVLVEKKNALLDQMRLQPHVNYTVDVQAKMCLGALYQGPWSEWSSTAEWRTTGTSAEIEGRTALYLPAWNQDITNFCLMLNQTVEASRWCYFIVFLCITPSYKRFKNRKLEVCLSYNFRLYILHILCLLYRNEWTLVVLLILLHRSCLLPRASRVVTKTVSTLNTGVTFFLSKNENVTPFLFLKHVRLQWDLNLEPWRCWCRVTCRT